MITGVRFREIREAKNLRQDDLVQRTGLQRCYISALENGHKLPSVETLEKIARALEMQLYEVFYVTDTLTLVRTEDLPKGKWGASGKSARYLRKLIDCLSRMDHADRLLVFELVKEVAKRGPRRKRGPKVAALTRG